MTIAGLLVALLEEEGVTVDGGAVVVCSLVSDTKPLPPPPLPLPLPPGAVSVVVVERLVMVITSQVFPANVEHNSL